MNQQQKNKKSAKNKLRTFTGIFISIIAFSLLMHNIGYCSLRISDYTVTISKKTKEGKDTDKKDEEKSKKKLAPINKLEFMPVPVGKLLASPQEYLNKKIKFRGKFSSFTTLALDYSPAMRSSKEYISLCIFRHDSTIPLSELKLSYPVEDAKENQVIRDLKEGDLLEIYGSVFSVALDEPWVDILSIDKIASGPKSKEKDKKEEDTKSAK